MIRIADIKDLKPLADEAHRFYEEAKLPGKVIPHNFIESWTTLLISGFGAIWLLILNDKICGALGATIIPDINDGELVAHEMFWYVVKEHRESLMGIRLFKEFERQTIQLGAKRVIMTHINNLNPESLKKFYGKMGYYPIETNYIKVV